MVPSRRRLKHYDGFECVLCVSCNVPHQHFTSMQILSDTKELQKEINNLTGKLDRTFAVTDELVFKVAEEVFLSVLLLYSCSAVKELH